MSDFWMKKKRNCHTGLTVDADGGVLLEVLVALVLTLLLLESFVELLLVGMNGIALAGQRTTACTYADSLLEEMKARPELLNDMAMHNTMPASDLSFSMPQPQDVRAYICLAPIDGISTLCQVRMKVISTKGNKQWEENLVGVVRTPAE